MAAELTPQRREELQRMWQRSGGFGVCPIIAQAEKAIAREAAIRNEALEEAAVRLENRASVWSDVMRRNEALACAAEIRAMKEQA